MSFWSGILGCRELIGPTSEFQGCMISEIMYCATEFETETLYSCVVCCVAEVATCVEWFFDAEGFIVFF